MYLSPPVNIDTSTKNQFLNLILSFFLQPYSYFLQHSTISSVVYFKFMATILAAIAWINCLVCTIFIITGFNKWCNSVTNNGNIERYVSLEVFLTSSIVLMEQKALQAFKTTCLPLFTLMQMLNFCFRKFVSHAS